MNINRTRYKTLPSDIKVNSSATIQDLTQTILNLNRTLQEENLELSTYDIMKITQTVATSDQFGQAKASLGYNDALIINSLSEFTIGTESFKRGDIIYKDNAGEYHTIKSQTAGYYKPIEYDNASHMLTFEYDTSISTGDATIKDICIYKDPGVYHIQYEVNADWPFEKKFEICYSKIDNLGGEKEEEKEVPIFPIIEVYYVGDDEKQHALNINYTLEKDDSNWIFKAGSVPFNCTVVIK